MKRLSIFLILIGTGAVLFFYSLNAIFQYKDQADAQAYQRKNMLEGIDVQPFNKPQ